MDVTFIILTFFKGHSSISGTRHAPSKPVGEGPKMKESINGTRPKQSLAVHKSGFLEGAANFREIWTSERIRVCVYSCDILKTRVDCIVNAANGHLNHDAGISLAIVLKAGHSLDAEGQALLKTTHRGCIEVGKACHTGAGNLQYKFVIHAVGPMWSDCKPYSEVKLIF
ncbi:hypothetical protein DPMN_165134 [Dreissena polymorpha]|uniref:Macro domain-containing protein n=1 Tax=Dreissena polymorpha TaxID=45954 RepID=A0A9D4EUT6_DREPO|nr:hypothetical protein DPMN_165134 [Dreissena polymorpha]